MRLTVFLLLKHGDSEVEVEHGVFRLLENQFLHHIPSLGRPAGAAQCIAQGNTQLAALAAGRPVIPDRLFEPGRPLSL